MRHLNDEYRSSLLGRLVNHLLPEEYQAESIGDFMNNRKEIRLTGWKIFPGSIFRGAAFIRFSKVDYRNRDGRHQFYDTTGSMDVEFHPSYHHRVAEGRGGKLEPIFHPGRYRAAIVYIPETNQNFIWSVEPHGNVHSEDEIKETATLHLEYA